MKDSSNVSTNVGIIGTPVTINSSPHPVKEVSFISNSRLNSFLHNIHQDHKLDISDINKQTTFSQNNYKNTKRKRGRPRKEYMPSYVMRLSKDNNKITRKTKYTPAGNTKIVTTVVSTVKKKTETINNNQSGNSQSSFDSDFVHTTFKQENQIQVMSEDNSSTVELDADASLMPAPEEPPYFAEKYPGKFCALCNLGERSQLGQGEILRLEIKIDDNNISTSAISSIADEKALASLSGDDKSPRSGFPLPNNRRQKGLNKCK